MIKHVIKFQTYDRTIIRKRSIHMYNERKPYYQNITKCQSNDSCKYARPCIKDYGPKPFVVNINEATKQNNYFRSALWTGCHLQVTLMSLKVGEEIGLEIHPDVDQFLRIEQGEGLVMIGDRRDCFDFKEKVCDDFAIMIPAGKWHNLVNTGCVPLKLYSIYAPPQHPRGTVHETKADAQEAEERHCY